VVSKPLFRSEVIQARGAGWLGGIVLAQPVTTRMLTAVAAAVALGITLFLLLGTYTQRARASGYLTSARGLATVTAPVAGVVRQLQLREGASAPGHWEGDLLFGGSNSQIATLVERHTRYVMLVKIGGKDTEPVIDALVKNAQRLPKELYRSLTWDRGKEMADHCCFTLVTDIQVYFCDPQHPWRRGSNENTNGLLR
jgi:hypothetical protein